MNAYVQVNMLHVQVQTCNLKSSGGSRSGRPGVLFMTKRDRPEIDAAAVQCKRTKRKDQVDMIEATNTTASSSLHHRASCIAAVLAQNGG